MALEALLLAGPLVSLAAAAAGFALGGPGARSRVKWGGLSMLIWPLPLLLMWRRARGSPLDEGAAAHVLPPGVFPIEAPSVVELARVPEPVKACPDCGWLGIRPPSVQDGVWPGGGELVFYVCPRCAYRGLPLELATREEYRRFLQALAAERREPHPAAEPL